MPDRTELYKEDEIKFTIKGYVPEPFHIAKSKVSGNDLTDAYFPGYPQLHPDLENEAEYNIKSERDLVVEAPGGNRIYLDVYRPDSDGKFPALISWGVWGKDSQDSVFWLRDKPQPYFDSHFWDGSLEAGDIPYLVSNGFAHVIPDPPGIGKSDGAARSMLDLYKIEDITKIVKWIVSQPWSNGKVGMIGPSSYSGSQVMIGQNPPEELKALFPLAFWWIGGEYDFTGMRDATRFNILHGAHGNDSTYTLSKENYGKPYTLDMPKEELESLMSEIFNDPDIKYNSKFYSLFKYPHKDPLLFDIFVKWFRPTLPPFSLEKIEMPIYIGAVLPGGGHRIYWIAYEAWEKVKTSEKFKKMIILPPGELRRPVVEYHDEYLRWFNHWLNGKDTQVLEEPPVKLFVLGVNKWKFENEWPPKRTESKNLYLHEGGLLSGISPHLGTESFTQHSPLIDNNVICLSYRTDPLTSDLELMGPLAAHIEASIDNPDANWIVSLVDVAPNGDKTLVSEGWLRSSFRELNQEKSTDQRPVHKIKNPELLVPGKEYIFDIPMIPTAAVILKGHALEFTIRGQDDLLSRKSKYGIYFLPQMRTVTYNIKFGKNTRVVLPVSGNGNDVTRKLENGDKYRKSV